MIGTGQLRARADRVPQDARRNIARSMMARYRSHTSVVRLPEAWGEMALVQDHELRAQLLVAVRAATKADIHVARTKEGSWQQQHSRRVSLSNYRSPVKC